jgi:hypothetical protein
VQRIPRALAGIAIAMVAAPLLAAFLPPLDSALAAPSSGAPGAAREGDGGAKAARAPKDPGCIYGKVLDGHTGEIRCLSPQEIGPPGPYDIPPPPDAGVDASVRSRAERVRSRDAGDVLADGAAPLRAASITVDSLEFENGDVPRAQAALERFARKDVSRCAVDHDWRAGGRRSESDAHIDLRFLVRAPGRAEGIDVSGARGLSAGLVQCITSALSNRLIGAPSADPVAVKVRFRFR